MSDHDLARYYVHANATICKSGKFNYEFCRFPVPTPWNIDRLEELLLLHKFDDMQIIQFLKYGWPVETRHLAEYHQIPPNQMGAKNSSKELKKYMETELQNNGIIGPFKDNPFGGKARISPIDAIPKKDTDDKHVILNLSHPDGRSVNDAIDKDTYLGQPTNLTYPTVDDLSDVIMSLGVGVALFKTDLRKYFRQVCYDPGCIHLMGFRINKQFYWDITLSMGLRIACFIAQRLSSAIMFIYNKQGNYGLNYIDDLAAAALWSKAYQSFKMLTDLLKSLNIWESEHKRCEPDVVMSFLGVGVNSLKMILELTPERIIDIRNETDKWLSKESASKKDLQSLIGKLNFAASTVRSGRLFFSRIITCMKNMPKHGICKIDAETRKDIKWWSLFMEKFNGVSMMHELSWRQIDQTISSDACLSGLGGFCSGEYFHCKIPERLKAMVSINELECTAVMIALKVWAERLSGLNILMHCDNQPTVKTINAGKAQNEYMQKCLREITYLAAMYSFQVRMEFKPGVQNRTADFLSRWENSPKFKELFFTEVSLTHDIMKLKQVLISDVHFNFSHNW